MLECKINHALKMLGDADRCMPWWLPPLDQDMRLCSPYEARNFSTKIHIMAQDVCKVIFVSQVGKVVESCEIKIQY